MTQTPTNAPGAATELIVSKSRTREAVRELNLASDFYEALDARVRELIRAAEKRAIANGRKTIKPCDL